MNRQLLTATSYARHIFRANRDLSAASSEPRHRQQVEMEVTLDKFQHALARKYHPQLRSLGRVNLSTDPNGSSTLRINHGPSNRGGIEKLVSQIQSPVVIPMESKVYKDYLKIKGLDLLDRLEKDNSCVAILDDSVVLGGENKSQSADRIERVLSELVISHVDIAHPCIMKLLIGKQGSSIVELTKQYPDVLTMADVDRCSVTVAGRRDEVDAVVDIIKEQCEGYGMETITKPRFMDTLTHPHDFISSTPALSLQDVSSKWMMHTWLVYGDKRTLDGYMSLVKEQMRQFGDFTTIYCPPHDYTSWHAIRHLLWDRTDVQIRYSDKKLSGSPGSVFMMGPDEVVQDLVTEMNQILQSADLPDDTDSRDPVIESVTPPDFVHLKLAEYYPFPNVKTGVDVRSGTLRISGHKRTRSSVFLAAEHYKSLMKLFKSRSFDIMRDQRKYLTENRDVILPALDKICEAHKVRYVLDWKERKFIVHGLPNLVNYAIESMERYFRQEHRNILTNFFWDSKMHFKKITIDHLKYLTMFGGKLRVFKDTHPTVMITSFPAKDGNTHVVVKSKDPEELEAAVATITDLADKTEIVTVELEESKFDIARQLIRSSGNALRNLLFTDRQDKPEVSLMFSKQRPEIIIAGTSRKEQDMSAQRLREFMLSIEKFEMLTLPVKNMLIRTLRKRADDLNHWDSATPSDNLLIIISKSKQDVLVLGGEDRVAREIAHLESLIKREEWAHESISLNEWPQMNGKEANRIKNLLRMSFPGVEINLIDDADGNQNFLMKFVWNRSLETSRPELRSSINGYVSDLKYAAEMRAEGDGSVE